MLHKPMKEVTETVKDPDAEAGIEIITQTGEEGTPGVDPHRPGTGGITSLAGTVARETTKDLRLQERHLKKGKKKRRKSSCSDF